MTALQRKSKYRLKLPSAIDRYPLDTTGKKLMAERGGFEPPVAAFTTTAV
jgi:hypothetical protein